MFCKFVVYFVLVARVKKIKSHNKRAHNQQEEKQVESWRTPNISGFKQNKKMEKSKINKGVKK